MKADAAFSAAITAHDQAALENLLEADFTWTSADGAVQARSEILLQLSKPGVASEKMQAYAYGDLADIKLTRGESTYCECG